MGEAVDRRLGWNGTDEEMEGDGAVASRKAAAGVVRTMMAFHQCGNPGDPYWLAVHAYIECPSSGYWNV
ncbi:hypothetical protein Nepgr_011155 [Nepenthes gracilis]|uniref:Uncharacterized protein n=1 Tax=Nepenthes gracilis TaxID=150966 RepID=A0AAD3XM12_NEPGR|nr:hypothetical protein Nepgr_011155 [Nepenthes gracilis]